VMTIAANEVAFGLENIGAPPTEIEPRAAAAILGVLAEGAGHDHDHDHHHGIPPAVPSPRTRRKSSPIGAPARATRDEAAG